MKRILEIFVLATLSLSLSGCVAILSGIANKPIFVDPVITTMIKIAVASLIIGVILIIFAYKKRYTIIKQSYDELPNGVNSFDDYRKREKIQVKAIGIGAIGGIGIGLVALSIFIFG